MSSKFNFKPFVFFSFLFLMTYNAQAQTNFFLPDNNSFIISQFDLKNGQQVRGSVIRIVHNTYYDIKLANGSIRTIREEEIAEKQKVVPDIRENSHFSDFGIGGASLIRSNEQFTALFFQLGTAKEFGKNKEFYVALENGFGRTFWISDDFDGEMMASNYWGRLGLGYHFNRLSKFNQSLSAGGAWYFNDKFNDQFLFIQADFPIQLSPNLLIVPQITYFTPLDGYDINDSMLLMGIRLRFYMPSVLF
jgi:translation initiation factor IF-1